MATHTLTVLAHQESTGTVTASASISVTVSNGAPTPTPTSTPSSTYQIAAPLNGATASGSVNITISTTLPLTNDWWNDLQVDGVSTGLTDSWTLSANHLGFDQSGQRSTHTDCAGAPGEYRHYYGLGVYLSDDQQWCTDSDADRNTKLDLSNHRTT